MWTEEPPVDSLRLAQEIALALAGAVAIPSPVPAVALVLIGRTPESAPARLLSPADQYYVRIVQFPSPGVIVSRYLAAGSLETAGDIRLIRGLIVDIKAPAEPLTYLEKTMFLVGADLLKTLTAVKESIALDGPEGEKILAKQAVVYVPESARVQIRTDRVTTAGESEVSTLHCDCCCPVADGGGHSLPW